MIVILATRRSDACLAALFPTVLIAAWAVLISWALTREAMTPKLPSGGPRGSGA